MKLYFHATPNSMKVAVLLEELAVPYEVVPVDIYEGEQHAPAFRAINPNGKLPALVDDGVAVFDSHAILIYLAEKHGRFLPTAVAPRAAVLSWLQLVATGLSPFSGQAVHFLHYAPERLPYATDRYVGEVARLYRLLEERLAASRYLGGTEYSIADVALFGWAASADYVFGERGLSDYPHVQRFMDEMQQRPAVARALQVKARHAFKTELDGEARRAMFTQGVEAGIGTSASVA